MLFFVLYCFLVIEEVVDMLEETDDRRSDFLRVIRGDSIVFCWTSVVDILAPSDLVLDREFRGRSDLLRGSSNDFFESSSVASISSTFSFLILQTKKKVWLMEKLSRWSYDGGLQLTFF